MRFVFDAKTRVDMRGSSVSLQTSLEPDGVGLHQQPGPVVTSFKINGVGANFSILRSGLYEETIFQFSSKHQFVYCKR